MNFFINDAFADTTATTSTTVNSAMNSLPSLLMLFGFVIVFYLLLWRPQAKRMKEQRQLLANLAIGDEVVTNSGLIGKVAKVTDSFIQLTVADGVVITLQKNFITSLLPKGTLQAI